MAGSDVEKARSDLQQLRTKLESDPAEMSKYKANMPEYLSKHGLSGPIQQDILREAKFPGAPTACSFISCVCTDCGIASLSV